MLRFFLCLTLLLPGLGALAQTVPTLDPQAKALLDQMAAAAKSAPASTKPLSAAEQTTAARQGYRATIPLAGPPEAIFKVEDRTVPGPAGAIPVRIYTPRPEKNLPVLVYFHGGGFTTGDLDTHDAPLRALANRASCLIVAVAYRLAPEHPYPAAPDDCYAATQWVARHAAELGGDPRQVVVGGDSAGGLLATVVALMARDRRGPALAGQLLLYPNTDATTERQQASWQQHDGLVLSRTTMNQGLAQYLPTSQDRRQAYVSPLYAASLKNLPPVVLVSGGFDPLRDEDQAYADRLKASGVAVTHLVYPGMIHGFFQMAGALDASKQLPADVAAALQKQVYGAKQMVNKP